MKRWFTRKTAVVDAIVCAGVCSPILGWFGEVMHGASMIALVLGTFALVQLLRVLNAQIAALQWAKLHSAVLVDERTPPVDATVIEGYRAASPMPAELPSADDELMARDVPRIRRRARISLGVVGALCGLATLVPAFTFGAWVVPGVAALLAVLGALFIFTMRNLREREAARGDFFLTHLQRDTKALLDADRGLRIASLPSHLRVGVDFGVPAAELDHVDEHAVPIPPRDL